MKNICFLIGDINHSGGTERVTSLIANNLVSEETKVHILSLSHGDNPFFELNHQIKTSALFTFNVSMRKNFIQCVKRIRAYLLSNKINTLIVADSISCVFTVPATIGLNIQHICWEHFNLKVNLGSKFRDLGRWMAAHWCDKIVTLTERDKNFWDEKFNLKTKNKVIAIPNPSPYSLQDNQPSLESKTILCVGRLTYQKGFDLLVEAWSQIAHELPGWKIILVGSGEDELKLKELTIEYKVSDSFLFLGQQKNMDEFYRKASFFCMSSRFEGLPMVLLEAQSYGLPIVAFDCDTGPSEILDHGSNGLLVEPLNIKDFAEKIKVMINGNYQKMVEISFSNSSKFNLNKISNIWVNLLGEGID
ncbi:glycosyltransferase family 4 protein [Acinetobacter lanii]|uniref:Glycosyltransferase family 4 protein n=1 Tax=Acinetobacter lanii TaxID=2715163 RepID=A0A6G8S7Q0_9GAMM|nr:glycosyltransferase family 4 protein [Acinetobacter lanii]QIO10187.1 glycosyltransferase family 4 protein [Acinetobacter lanii]